MVGIKLIAFFCLLLSAWEGVQAQGAEDPALPPLHRPHPKEFEHYLWPSTTIADTRLAHSSASQKFWVNRRRLLAVSKTAAQAADGEGKIVYRPVGFNIDGDDFAKFFTTAHANKRATGIRVDPGTYHVSANIQDSAHLYMRCRDEREDVFEVDFTGVFFYFTDYQHNGVSLDNCTNVDLHGPWEQTYTNDQLDFAQGVIVGVNEDELEYTVEIDDGYPAERVMMREPIAVSLFHNDTLLIKSPDPYMDIIVGSADSGRKKLGDRRYSFKARGVTPNVTVGNFFTARGQSGTVGMRFEKVKNSTARDFTIFHSGGFGVYEPFGQNNTFMNIQIRPFPLPIGRDGKLPMLSTGWDAIHAKGAHKGTLVKNNFIVNSGDDAVAMSGFYYLVAAVDPGKRGVVIASDREYTFNPGDLLTFYALDTERLGTARITKMYSVEQPKETTGKTSKVGEIKYDDADFMQVFLDRWPASMDRLRTDDVASSPSNNGDGFAIVNNTIGNLRGRGILCKSSNGVIAHNRLFNLKGFGIQMSPEHLWVESDFVNNVLVLNNTVNSYGPGIWLGVDPTEWGTPGLYTNNYNVDFINNTITNCATSPFLLTSAAGISVINTTFVNVLCTQKDTKSAWMGDWQVQGTLAMVANVKDVTFSGNTVVKDERCKYPHGNYDRPVAMVNATNVNGLVPRTSVDSLLQAETP